MNTLRVCYISSILSRKQFVFVSKSQHHVTLIFYANLHFFMIITVIGHVKLCLLLFFTKIELLSITENLQNEHVYLAIYFKCPFIE